MTRTSVPVVPEAEARAGAEPEAVSQTPEVHVLVDRCAGCQECIVRCPAGALSLDAATWTAQADQDACVGCRQCVRTCPFAAITVEGPEIVPPRIRLGPHHPDRLDHDRTETRRAIGSWAEALAEANRCLGCPDPTCVRGCPAHNDIPGFLRALRAGDLDEAHRVLRRTTVLPDVCSRVCDQAIQCEGACTWALADGEPVAIGALERFVADNAPIPAIAAPVVPSTEHGAVATAVQGLEVAVVGSGPAGIGAAAELVAAGASVTVFERDTEPGGLLRWGIPDFTLPDAIARRPWDDLQAAGARLCTGQEIAADALASLTGRFDAVVVATGAPIPLLLPVDGGDLDGVWDATRFLRTAHAALASGSTPRVLCPRPAGGDLPGDGGPRPVRVLVLGAGNTAMDVARSARRLGAEVCCVDWMDRRFAPVRPDELEEAAAEGVEVRFSTTLRRLDGDGGHVVAAVLAGTRQQAPAQRPEVVEGPTTTTPVDLVVMAMGYRIDPDVAGAGHGVPVPRTADGLADRRWSASGILANPEPAFARRQPVGRLALGRAHAAATAALARHERVWFAGDALVGPSTVVEAMTQGKIAAQAIAHRAPRRPEAGGRAVRRVLVATESRGGTVRAIGATVGSALAAAGSDVRTVELARVGPAELAWADALVVGTWVEGAVVARVGPARATRAWLEALPPLPGVPVVIFCSYAVAPRGTLATMGQLLRARGARVVGEAAFRRGGSDGGIAAFVGALEPAMEPAWEHR